ncbi:MAG TPA: hypothetical protein DEQ98_09985 [Acidobacteria bacterium]|nr:hypothetical protein [Acidobacteriota bacterium]HCE03559.1 hypothetical protein [Acidobacteriota bacterium]
MGRRVIAIGSSTGAGADRTPAGSLRATVRRRAGCFVGTDDEGVLVRSPGCEIGDTWRAGSHPAGVIMNCQRCGVTPGR